MKNRQNTPIYSYKQFSTEGKKLYRRLALLVGIIIVTTAVIWFWGTTFVQIIGALGDNEPASSGFNIPLLKPVVSSLPESTNKERISISGFTTSNAQVVLFINGIEVSTNTADETGNFTFVDVTLREGLNFVKLHSEFEGQKSEDDTFLITLDRKPPTLQITKPKDGDNLSNTNSITIEGSTEPDAKVFINSIQTTIDRSGNFTYILGVSPGENEITVKATDKAGNNRESKISVTIEGD